VWRALRVRQKTAVTELGEKVGKYRDLKTGQNLWTDLYQIHTKRHASDLKLLHFGPFKNCFA
jgi:hypothetical protein